MKKLITIGAIALSLVITYVAAGPYLAFSEIKAGIAEQDSVKMSKNIDFPALRQNIKEQINAVMMQNATEASDENPFALIAAGIATAMTDKITESLITPTGLAAIMHGKFTGKESGASTQTTGRDKLFKDEKLSFDSLDTFSARVKNENGDEFRIVLQREGIQWKMTNIILPDPHALNQATD
jgi:hypothetical protein